MSYEQAWIAIGLIGQFMFTSRFIVQWLSSERNKRVTIPVAFWFLSIAGSLLLLTYAIHKRDVVFILGQSSGLFIYLRNLHLARNELKLKAAADTARDGNVDSAVAGVGVEPALQKAA